MTTEIDGNFVLFSCIRPAYQVCKPRGCSETEQYHKNCMALCILVHDRMDKMIKAIMQNISTI